MSHRPPPAPPTFGEWLDQFIEATEETKRHVAARIFPGGDSDDMKSAGIVHTRASIELDTLYTVRHAANNYGVQTTKPRP